MQSMVLSSVSAKNALQAHATAAQLVAATMNNKQSQHDCKCALMKEFADDLGRGSMGRAMAKKELKGTKKGRQKMGRRMTWMTIITVYAGAGVSGVSYQEYYGMGQ